MRKLITLFVLIIIGLHSFAQHGEEHSQDESHHEQTHQEEHTDAHNTHGETSDAYNPTPMIMHHIADANEWRLVGDIVLPLPVMIYNRDHKEWFFGMSSQFKPDSHGEGTKKVGAYKMSHSRVVPIDGSRYWDFSITKNVATLLFTSLLMLWLFTSVARGYKKRTGQAPKGLQSFFEPLILFVRDDIAKPNLGKHTDRFLPYLMAVFFFIWIGNMIGQIAPIASPNLTGNIAVTASLALFTLLITNISGTKHYWKHLVDPMGKDMPLLGKIPLYLVLVPIELMGIFIKPAALMIRLFANITAGHIIVLSLVSLIFVFGNAGESIAGSIGGAAVAVPFTLFISLIEILVAFLQAFIFTILSAVFIGMAVDDGHH